MVVEPPSFFQSLSETDLEHMQATLPRRQFAAGETLLAEGDRPTEMYVITSGMCAVFVRDRDGLDSRVGQIGPGATIGEMSLFAGQLDSVTVAPATLRALTALDVVTLDAPAFYALATAFPQVLHNIGAILSQRLTRSYQHALRAEHGHVTALLDYDAPPLLAYALAASVAWHSRAATLLVAVGYTDSVDLEALATRNGGALRHRPGRGRARRRAHLAHAAHRRVRRRSAHGNRRRAFASVCPRAAADSRPGTARATAERRPHHAHGAPGRCLAFRTC